jgi:uncharacterized protein (TIGR01244 family)
MKLLIALLAGTLAVAACADESAPVTPAKVLVDVSKLSEDDQVRPVDGITAAGQPDAKAFAAFANSGYEVVIDMRGPDEDRGLKDEAALVEDLGLEYVAFPITDEKQIDFETARKLDDLLASIDGPVLIHCASSNRVGALLALRESLNGASDEDALAYGKRAGMTRLEPVVRERLNSD